MFRVFLILRQARGININIKLFSLVEGRPLQS